MQVKAFTKNAKMADGGVWIEDIPGTDLRLKVRASNSRIVRRALADKAMSTNSGDEDARATAIAEVYAETILLDWDNLFDGDVPIKYSADLARKWLVEADTSEFYDLVETASFMAAARARVGVDSLEGN